jgi:hypothetical protein
VQLQQPDQQPSKAGHPSWFSHPEKMNAVVSRMVTYIEHGMPIHRAAEGAGMPSRTFCRYRQVGKQVEQQMEELELEEPDDRFTVYEKGCLRIWRETRKAEIGAMDRNLLTIQVASQNQWQAAAWWLERKFPKEFGRQVFTVAGDKANPVQVEVSDKDSKVKKALAALTVEQLELLETVARTVQE